jgi:hypothetical protein
MPAAWTSKDDRQYVAIKTSCYKRRRCTRANKSGHTACITACFPLAKGSRRIKCIRACKSPKLCRTDCNSMAAATVNKYKAKAAKKRTTKKKPAKRRK